MKLGPNQTAWLEALESGEFKQCSGSLEDGDRGYCCLGVACIVMGNQGVPVILRGARLVGATLDEQLDVALALGLRSPYGTSSDDYAEQVSRYVAKTFEFVRDPYVPDLTDLNDRGMSHKEIAQVIRKFPEAFFKESK